MQNSRFLLGPVSGGRFELALAANGRFTASDWLRKYVQLSIPPWL